MTPLPLQERVIKAMLEAVELPFGTKIAIMAEKGPQYEQLKKNAKFFLDKAESCSMEDGDTLMFVRAMGLIQSSKPEEVKQQAFIAMQSLKDKYPEFMNDNKVSTNTHHRRKRRSRR